MAFLMGKISSYPDADNLPGRTEANYPAPHSQHIGIIVLTGHAGREYIMAESCPDALDLVGSNGNPSFSPVDIEQLFIIMAKEEN